MTRSEGGVEAREKKGSYVTRSISREAMSRGAREARDQARKWQGRLAKKRVREQGDDREERGG